MRKKQMLILFITLLSTFFFLPTNIFADEVPVTVKSGEAEKLFMEARTQDENLDFQKSWELYKKVLELDPGCAMAYLNLSQNFSQTSAQERDDFLQKALALKTKVSQAERLMIEAQEASVNNNPDQAIKLLEKVAESYPKDKRAHTTLGSFYYFRDKDDMAITELKKSISLDKAYAPAYNMLGYAYMETGQFDESEKAFKTYISLIPDQANPHDSIGDLYAKMGKHLEAIEHFRKAVELNPTFAASQRKIGDHLVFIGKFDEAREAYAKANTLESGEQGKITNSTRTALSYLYEGKEDKALSEMDNAVTMAEKAKLPSRQAGVLLGKAWIAINQNKTDIARTSITKAQEIIKNNKLPQYVVQNLDKNILFSEALIFTKEKKTKEADEKVNAFTKAVKDGKDSKEMQNVHQLEGLVAIERGDFKKAAEELAMANQEDPLTLYNLGMAYNKTGNKDQANAFYSKAAEWNINTTGYALIRNDAQAALKVLAGD